MNIKYLTTALAVTGSLLLAGCGDSTNSTGGSRISGTVTSVSADESQMTVANINFDTSNASITTDGSKITNGMTVQVDGSIDGSTGVATKVTYDSEIEGIVMAHDSGAKTMTVMGQAVSYTDATIFDDKSSGTQGFDPTIIVPGNVVEISGMLVNGVVEASRVEYESDFLSAGEDVELKGYVANYVEVDSITSTFSLGNCAITVDLDDASNTKTIIDNNLILADGAFVEVKSILTANDISLITGGTCAMLAAEIESEEDENEYDDIDEIDDNDVNGVS